MQQRSIQEQQARVILHVSSKCSKTTRMLSTAAMLQPADCYQPAGIGFKATAVASEVTYISSSGYTFSFDMRPGSYSVPCLGLVCPCWEEGLQQDMRDWLNHRLTGGTGQLVPAD